MSERLQVLEKLNGAIQELQSSRQRLSKCEDILTEPQMRFSKWDTVDMQTIQNIQDIENNLYLMEKKIKRARNNLLSQLDESDIEKLKSHNAMVPRHSNPNQQTDIIAQEINRVHRKIPMWKHRPQQYNHIILDTYFILLERDSVVTVQDLKTACEKGGVDKFYGNYTQMKVIAKNNHAKVFEETHDGYKEVVTLWDPTGDGSLPKFIKEEWER